MIDTDLTVYIAGPMTGLPEHNYPAFFHMEKYLNSMGYNHVINPATIANGDTTKEYSFYIRESLKLISKAEFVIFLDNWQKSKGARLEKHCADSMGIPCYDQRFNLLDVKETVCQEADNLVSNDRQEQYGHPLTNFSDIAVGWNLLAETDKITPEKVGLMMMWLKICREKYKTKRDNLVDICGFAKTIDMINEKRNQK